MKWSGYKGLSITLKIWRESALQHQRSLHCVLIKPSQRYNCRTLYCWDKVHTRSVVMGCKGSFAPKLSPSYHTTPHGSACSCLHRLFCWILPPLFCGSQKSQCPITNGGIHTMEPFFFFPCEELSRKGNIRHRSYSKESIYMRINTYILTL